MSREETSLVSAGIEARTTGNGTSSEEIMTPDGRFVAFQSYASDLVPDGVDENGTSDIFRRDRATQTTVLISVDVTGQRSATQGGAIQVFHSPIITPDGRFVVFSSASTDLISLPISSSATNIFRRDTVTQTTALVTINAAGTDSANDFSEPFGMSDDGRYVLFASAPSDLVPNFVDGNGNRFPYADEDLFVRDTQAGKTVLVTINAAGTASGTHPLRAQR